MKKVYLITPKKIGTVSPEIYGHFTEMIGGVFYDGLWVGKDSEVPNINGFRKEIIEKLRAINVPVLRWPGGCFAETYDWRDGVGENRPVRPGWWLKNDGRYESNAVGTDEFMDLCELIGAKGYFAANLTSSTPLHILRWMDYCLSPAGTTELAEERAKNGHPEPFDIPFWGVGNENWGGGGNMRPEFYADECRRYATVMHNFAPGAELFACGTDATRYEWANGVIPGLGEHSKISGFAMHYYCGHAGGTVDFTEDEWDMLIAKAERMEEIINRNWNVICAHGMGDKIRLVVDEWGCWHTDNSGPSGGYNLFEQQSTMRDAVITAQTLNIFNRNCDKVRMANAAQLVNNIHCLFLAGGEHCITTPTYYVYDMYKGHQGAEAIDTFVEDNGILEDSVSVSATVKNGRMLISVANLSCRNDAEISLSCVGAGLARKGVARVLANSDMHAHNTFESPDTVTAEEFAVDTAAPVTVPKAGVLTVEAETEEE